MKRRTKYFLRGLAVGVGLTGIYTANMAYRFSKVAEHTGIIERARITLRTSRHLLDDSWEERRLSLDQNILHMRDIIESERNKAYFVIDLPGLFKRD